MGKIRPIGLHTYLKEHSSRYDRFVLNWVWVFYTSEIFGSGIYLTLNMERLRYDAVFEFMITQTVSLVILITAVITIVIHQISLRKKWRLEQEYKDQYIYHRQS